MRCDMNNGGKQTLKKRISFLLALVLILALSAPAFAAGSENKAVQTVRALGIMIGDDKGNMNLSEPVTRAQFAKMMVAASAYKDTIGDNGSGFSLFRDVKSSHWASEYIRLAVQQGWVVGYTDGCFRPDNPVKLEEACTALERMLGYDSSMLAGSWPGAQLSKATALGLRDDLACVRGQALTRSDCATLFYNLLTAQTAAGKTYALTLGYSLSASGEVDYASVTKNNLSGPYIAAGGTKLPFTPLTVYRNGKLSDSAALNINDVYYYNTGLRTAWIYTERTSGKIMALAPTASAPTTVNVAGVNYAIGSADATFALSALGGGRVGAYVTLLLGMDDMVVGVLTGSDMETIYYGVVKSSVKTVSTEDSAKVQTSVSVVCSDGVQRTFTVDKEQSFTEGKLVSVNVTGSGTNMRTMSESSMSGRVSADASFLGDLRFADNVRILDTAENGAFTTVDADRLAGCTLGSGKIRCCILNTAGEIEDLILDNVTGDVWTYGYLTELIDASFSMQINVSYIGLADGAPFTFPAQSVRYPVDVGGVAFCLNDSGALKHMQPLQSLKLSELGALTGTAGEKKYPLDENVQVYLRKGDSYYPATLSSVNAQDYTLTGWYDDFGCPAGGRIRVIVAAEK
ncbi:MAG: S-layer homology domain-containing protein [Ruminococcaceae bacterium]|nr:S-layer homology domain-containing protein [Oscillospiraceae bacterium]